MRQRKKDRSKNFCWACFHFTNHLARCGGCGRFFCGCWGLPLCIDCFIREVVAADPVKVLYE